MKRNLLIFVTVLTLTALITTGCKKFLEKPPQGQETEDEALKDEAGVQNFLNGEYTLVGDADFLGGRVQSVRDMLADELNGTRFTGDFAEIFKRQNSIFGGTRDALYSKGYRIINVANVVIKNLDKISADNQDYVKGQALFCRALAHFELVRLFAQPYGYSAENSHPGIPLRTEVNISSLPRATVKEVYDQVIADLKEADDLLPAVSPDGKYYKATKWAAEAYLAKVYFQMNDFANAYLYADQVISSNKFVLDNTYDKRFSTGLTKEGIFTIANEVGKYQPGTELRGNYRSDQTIPVLNYTDFFYNYATSRANDVRMSWYSNTLQAGYNVITKYNKDYFDVPIVHLTEIKLIRAESGGEIAATNPAALAKAIGDMNDILTRAYGGTSNNLPLGSNGALVISTARTERELEMVAEGNRVDEIKRIGVRSGVNVDRRGSPWNCNGFILQFPKSEQDAYAPFALNPEGGCF